MRKLLLFVVLILGSCKPDVAAAPIHIHPDFSDSERAIIVAMFEEWCISVKERCTTVDSNPPYNILRASNDDVSEVQTGRIILGWSTTARMRLWPDRAGTLHMFEGVVRHEFGHYFGGYHIKDGRALSPGTPSKWTCISKEDIREVCSLYGGCQGETFPNCPEEDK